MRRIAHRLPPAAPYLVAMFAAVYWATCSLLIHRSFHSNAWDLGLMNQVIWNTAHGRWFEYSFRDISYVGDHWQPILLAFVPLKFVTDGPESLLLAQALLLAAAIIPLHAAAARLLGPRAAWAPVLAYTLGLGAARAVSFDFHAEAITPLLVFTGFWALVRRSRGWFLASVASVLLTKEDGVLVVLALCWLAWRMARWPRTAAGLAAFAVVYAAVVNVWLIPRYRGDELNPLAERYGYLGSSIGEVLFHTVTRPDVVADKLLSADAMGALAILLLGVVALPVLRPSLLPALAIVALPPLLSQDESQPKLELHYLLVPGAVALVLATTALAGLKTAPVIRGASSPMLASGVWGATSLILFFTLSPLPPSLATDWRRFDVDSHARVSSSFVRLVPDGSPASAQSPFVAHLSEREDIFVFPRVLDAEWVLLDEYGPRPADDLSVGFEACEAALPRLGFDLVREEDGITLWHKTRPAESVPGVPVHCSGQRPRQLRSHRRGV